MKPLKLFIKSFHMALSQRTAYRGDFFISLVMLAITEIIAPMIVIIIYKQGKSFPGWNLYEVLLIQGIFTLSRGICAVFFDGLFYNIGVSVREGTFDLILLKPLPALFTALLSGFSPQQTGGIFAGIGLTAYALFHLPSPGLFQWLSFFAVFILSLMVLLSFTFIMSATIFKWVGNFRLNDIFDNICRFGLYPSSIFPQAVKLFTAVVIPVAVIGFFPASILLGKAPAEIIPSLITAVVFFILSIVFWYKMLKSYTSAGG